MTTKTPRCKCGKFRNPAQKCQACNDPAPKSVQCNKADECRRADGCDHAEPHERCAPCTMACTLLGYADNKCIPVPTPDAPAECGKCAELRQRLEEINIIRLSSNTAGNARIKELDDEIKRLKAEWHKALAELATAREERDDARKQLAAAREERDDARKQLAAVREECERLKAELADAETGEKLAEDERDEIRAERNRERAIVDALVRKAALAAREATQ